MLGNHMHFCTLTEISLSEAIERSGFIAEAEDGTVIEPTHLERVLPQLLLDFSVPRRCPDASAESYSYPMSCKHTQLLVLHQLNLERKKLDIIIRMIFSCLL